MSCLADEEKAELRKIVNDAKPAGEILGSAPVHGRPLGGTSMLRNQGNRRLRETEIQRDA